MHVSELHAYINYADPVGAVPAYSFEIAAWCEFSKGLVLQLPNHLTEITQHYVDFVRYEQHETTLKVKGCMQQRWSDIIRPAHEVKVKIKGNFTVVEKSHYIAKLSSNLQCTFTGSVCI